LGLSKKEIDYKLDRIISFADIKQFIDAPLFTYSSGMKLRLGFAVSIYADPDILLLDENMVVGDTTFQHKSQREINKFAEQGKTILIVSHWFDFIKKTCNRIVILDRGKIVGDGPKKIINQYGKK